MSEDIRLRDHAALSRARRPKINAWRRKRYKERREESIKLLGGKCVKCGTTETLEFDHIDPSTKKARINSILVDSYERFAVEIAKCQLLCISCHSKKSQCEKNPNCSHNRESLEGRCKECLKEWRAKNKSKLARNRKRYKESHLT